MAAIAGIALGLGQQKRREDSHAVDHPHRLTPSTHYQSAGVFSQMRPPAPTLALLSCANTVPAGRVLIRRMVSLGATNIADRASAPRPAIRFQFLAEAEASASSAGGKQNCAKLATIGAGSRLAVCRTARRAGV